MRILIVGVGSIKNPGLAALEREYVKRASGFLTVELEEIREHRGGGPEQNREKESTRILERVGPRDLLVACDEKGKEYTSRGLAKWLGKVASDPGTARVVVAVGGSEGHHPRLIEQARLRLALSRLTFPHELARVVLAEQVYRALAILNNHPYHRGRGCG